MKIKVSRVIAAPPETVFDFIADTRNDTQWAPLVSDVEQLEGDGPRVGARYRFTQTARGRSFPVEIEMTRCERPSAVAWMGESRGRQYRSTMEIVPHRRGCRVRQVNDVDYGVKGLLVPVVFVIAHRVLRQQLRNVSRLVEGKEEGSA